MNICKGHVFRDSKGLCRGTGWLAPMPDMRDYSVNKPDIAVLSKKLGFPSDPDMAALPRNVDLRAWCSPIEDQQQLGSCTANAAVGIVEYYERRAFGKHIDGSRLFVYKVIRNLMKEIGDTGGYLRTAMAALCLCGVPPEEYWPYTDHKPDFDLDPPPFVYAIADNYEGLTYFCHDPFGLDLNTTQILTSVKLYLAAGIPSMFGFYGFPSFEQSDGTGLIPFPTANERAAWGHAVVAVGYDDAKEIGNVLSGVVTKGALLLRNSWGMNWGEDGYGWLPYEYVIRGLATDFWSLLSMKWLDSEQFGM